MHILLIALLLCLLPLSALAEPLTLVHATDLHYISPKLTDKGEYFTRMLSQGDGKFTLYCEELTEAFIEEMLTLRPKAVILSGDVTFNGAKESHRALEERLRVLPEAGVPVFVLPGNHDLYNRNAARFHGDGFTRVDSATAEDFLAIWHAYGYDQARSLDPSSLSYLLELPDLFLLFVDVNTSASPGVLQESTLAWCREALQMAKASGKKIIGVSHQTLMGHNALFSDGFQMGRAQPLQTLFAESGVLLNLSGHMHIQHTVREPFPEIVTSAMAVSPNRYGILSLDEDTLSYTTRPVDIAAWAQAHGKAEDPVLGSFSSYSLAYFVATSLKNSTELLTGREDADALASYMGSLNAAYFAGDMTAFSPEDPEYKTLLSLPGFFPIYLRSMMPDLGQSYTTFSLTVGD